MVRGERGLLWTMLIWRQVRMFKDIDVDKLNLLKFDGAAKLEPRYEV